LITYLVSHAGCEKGLIKLSNLSMWRGMHTRESRSCDIRCCNHHF
jgi:hypothetical protein